MKIAVLIRHFDPAGGGAERYAIALVQQLASRHEIHVFAQHFRSEIPGVIQHRVPQLLTRPRWLNLWWFAAWTARQTRHGFDIVHSHEAVWHGNVHTMHVRPIRATRFLCVGRFKRLLRQAEILFSPRLMYYFGVERARLRASPRRAIIAVSNALRDELETVYPHLHGKIDIIPPGVNPAIAQDDRAQTRQRYGIPPEAPLLLFIAGDYDKKGLPALMTALAKQPDAHLLVVGNENYIPAARQRAEALGITARVHFASVLTDPTPAYRAADLLVHPTLEDTFGMVVAEAMAYGLPVIVSGPHWCGIAAHLHDGDEALLLTDPRDSAEIAAAISRILSDPVLRTRLSAAGQRFATQYDWPALANRQETLYERILGTSQPEQGHEKT
ncbi:MAG: glycosyltransferase family 4 protein [Betaproteobacteria bacterium]|nr:glycosyltransferase family 4 protein [Betaproteobacteria bacterium]